LGIQASVNNQDENSVIFQEFFLSGCV